VVAGTGEETDVPFSSGEPTDDVDEGAAGAGAPNVPPVQEAHSNRATDHPMTIFRLPTSGTVAPLPVPLPAARRCVKTNSAARVRDGYPLQHRQAQL
jgi:hypothetical protein